ncbi:MAG TPA: pentapeptide repeat-containing protein, partial [Thermoanaerobaculia bacterium]|nr:pentapeptide repeat-containing protein [Thermoanaerobaculia bacterium]
ELVRLGLRPIRVLLGDVRLDRGLSLPEALTKGIRLTDDIHCPAGLAYSPPDDLLDSSTFNQRITFGGAVICPYVLILDGWDEISISVEEGFKLRLGRMLESLRTTFLHNPHVPIRVILTGRPSTAVTESTFLLKQTPILTIRPLRPEQIEEYVSRVADRLRRPLVPLEGTGWTPFDAARFKPAIATYRTAFAKAIEGGPDQAHIEAQDEGPGDNRLDVFGLPLLLHLSVRLLSIPGVDMAATIASPTALFRGLVDLTCGKSGKAENAPEEIEHQYRLSGQRLRELLRWTAGAMTAYGQESISFEELRLRLKLAHIELAARVERDTEHNILSQLLVSYYFKGGRTHLGCEFVHKSFREYLFAEGIVEILKSFACAITVDLAERENYWQDFAPDDPRLELTRTLSPWLAPQWLSREVASHLRHLIEWEVHRGTATASPENTVGQPMAPLCIEGWMRIRDVLADLWDWWGEGVHLRPQLARDDRDNMVISPPYAQLLVEWAMPRDVGRIGSLPRPRRFTTIDSNLGDALFLLTAAVHFQLASRLGWLQPVLGASRPPLPAELWQDVSLPGQGPRRCQSEVRHQPGTPSIRFFEPFGGSPDYFRNYVARINAAGWRPLGPFPDGADLRAVDLRQVVLSITSPDPGSMITVWDYANLDGASIGGPVVRHSFRHVLARKVKMVRAQLLDVDLGFSNLKGAILFRASLVNSNLAGVDCRDAILYGADLRLSKLREADLRGANFTRALLGNADLTGALLNHANFSGADLTHATLTNASCSIINLHWKANLGATTDPPDAFIELNSRAPESPQDPEGEPIFYYL